MLSIGASLLLVLLAGLLAFRGVDGVEIVAVLLYLPIFLALMMWGLKGGLIAGTAAAIAYAAMRISAAEIVGFDAFLGLIVFRAGAYIAFGAVAGWAANQLEDPLRKLEQHDLIDDDSGLFNARFFLRETAVEVARAERYGSGFSIVVIELPKNGNTTDYTDLGRVIKRSLRTADRPIHADTGEGHLFVAILPETPAAGAQTVAEKVSKTMATTSPLTSEAMASRFFSYPADRIAFQQLRDRFVEIDRREHPEEAVLETARAGDGRTDSYGSA